MTFKGRTQRAVFNAILSYANTAFAIGAAFFVTPFVLSRIGAKSYGLWLSSGEVIGYLMMLDFGVFSILPWLIARLDGQQAPEEIRRILSQGTLVALGVSACMVTLATIFWASIPVVLRLTPAEWRELSGPLRVAVALAAVNLPLNVFWTVAVGMQDVKFTGAVGLTKTIFTPLLTVGLLFSGHGLYALAFSASLVSVLVGVAALWRVRCVAPTLLRGWPRPTWQGTIRLFRESIGAWLASTGVQLIERSSAILLTSLGNPALVPTLACTSRVPQMLMQMGWVVPDSSLIGFAQLGGEANPARLREVALAIIRLHLVAAGLMACVVLAINPAFVRIWVGPQFFGGLALNGLLAVEVIGGSLAHALATILAVQGHRLSIGVATLLQGAFYLLLAVTLSRHALLEGLIAADVLAPLLSILPIGLWLLRSFFGIGPLEVARTLGAILLLRAGPLLLAAGAYGYWRAREAWLLELMAVGMVIGVVYLRLMRHELAAFPLPARISRWLGWLRVFERAKMKILFRQPLRDAYLPTLDGWRAVAICAVMVCHADLTLRTLGVTSASTFAAIGWLRLGVDLFFAISGFLICYRLLQEFESGGRISLAGFYTRRAFRIFPLYFTYLALLFIFSKTASLPVSGEELRGSFLFYRNYDPYPPEGGYTFHYWSLAVEEHFYLLWPMLLASLGPVRSLWTAPALALLIHVWRAFDTRFQIFAYAFPHNNALWRTDSRLDALLWGCFAALLYARHPVRLPGWSPFVLLAALVAGIRFHVPMQPLFFAALFPLLIVSTVSHPAGILSRALEWAPLRWVGRLSFSLYVWQTLFLQTSVSPDPTWLAAVKVWPVNLLMVILFAVASHYLIERPMIRLGRRCLGSQRRAEPVGVPGPLVDPACR